MLVNGSFMSSRTAVRTTSKMHTQPRLSTAKYRTNHKI